MYQHNINPIAFYIFDLPISWYWLFYPLGFFIVYTLASLYCKSQKRDYNQKDFVDVSLSLWFAAILGGRLGYFLLYQPQLLIHDPSSLLEIWRGGMSFHGAFIFAVIAILGLQKIKHTNLRDYISCILLFLPFALFLGRIGNFINGELWGTPTDLPWGVIFSKADFLPRHPSQFYEAILEGPVLYLLLWYSRHKISTLIAFPLFYGILRFSVEFTREADRHLGYFLGLSLGQYLSLIMFLVSLGFLLFRKRHTSHL